MNPAYDVIVVGSGGAGLVAALAAAGAGRRVLVLEQSDQIGGTTAWAGFVWAPNHHLLDRAGIGDSREDALAYCRATTVAGPLTETFVDTMPEVARWIEDTTPVRWKPMDYPDSFAELPSGRARGRHLEVQPVDSRPLGEWRERLRMPTVPATLTNDEVFSLQLHLRPDRAPAGLLAERTERGQLCGGVGLVSGLLAGCLAAGAELRLGARVRDLAGEGSRVTGVTLASGEEIGATQGVVLACGGFEWNERLRSELLVSPLTSPASPPLSNGDGLLMASRLGARLAHVAETWAWPTVPARAGGGGSTPSPLCLTERIAPHSVWVNRRGRRFTAESSHNCALAFADIDPTTGGWANTPAWAVVDARFRERYPFGGSMPGQADPPAAVTAATIGELAGRLGIDPVMLAESIERFNEPAQKHHDPDFGRGQSAYEHYLGDHEAPHPNLGAVSVAPFSALPVLPGAVGTKGGPAVDTDARVLGHDGTPIAGLYAAGNTAARIFGPGTPAAGATLASAIALGFRAGRRLAGS